MALDPNMSSWVGMKIAEELGKCCELMNLNGADRRVYELCVTDFWDYAGFLERNCTKIEAEDQTHPVMEFKILQHGGFSTIYTEIKGIGTKEIDECIHVFVQQWWKKYHERCKIVFVLPSEPPKIMSTIDLQFRFSVVEQKAILEMLTDTYIKYGEICCPSILADQLFRRTVGASERKEWNIETKINLLNQMKKEARHMSYLHGALIFIRPDKKFYLREWRNDGATKTF